MENQVPMELGHTPKICKLFVDDPFFDRVQEIHDLIARRAYELFECSRRAHGSDREHWLRAESEILHPMPLEITVTEAEIGVRAEVPGFGAKHLEIGVTPRRLFILGERQGVLERSEGKTVRSGHPRSLLLGTLELANKVDPDRVRATVDDGLLEVTLPTAQVAKISMLAKAASV
jgi:HSP20 family molecular chaperone IbpA